MYCTLHWGFFKYSFACCLNAFHFDCVRLCWLAIAKVIKFPKERLLRARSCTGLVGRGLQHPWDLQRALCRTRGNNPSRLSPPYSTSWVCAVNWGLQCVQTQDAIMSSFFILFIIFFASVFISLLMEIDFCSILNNHSYKNPSVPNNKSEDYK